MGVHFTQTAGMPGIVGRMRSSRASRPATLAAMDEAFIIMQIGNSEMDTVCDDAFVPAIVDSGLRARRVDRHNEGDLLKSEIVGFIERSEIIVADLTNARPNCYLEVGYAMGLGKKKNLILTVRADHHHSHENWSRTGPRLHFDLEGYDILFWEPSDLETLRKSTITTFGWPIGIVLDNRDEFRPRPTSDGIEAEVSIKGTKGLDHSSYDFWKLYGDGRFYTLLSLFEDERTPNSVFWDTRTNRVTEALLLLVRLYRRLGASDNDRVSTIVRHGGLAGRELRVANSNRMMGHHPATGQDIVETPIAASLSELEMELPTYVRSVIQALLVVFDFYSVADHILDEVIDGFIAGDVK